MITIKKTALTTLAFIAVVMTASCERNDLYSVLESHLAGETYAIGDIGPSGVGIVFYVTDGGRHGFELAPVDQSAGAGWSNITDAFANGSTALPAAIGTGFANTNAIIAQPGHTASAAQICRD